MFSYTLVINTYQIKQAVFLIEQRKEQAASKEELQDMLLGDLWSRRYEMRRIPVKYEWLVIEVAKRLHWKQRLYSFLSLKSPNYSVSDANSSWLTHLHLSADMVNSSIDSGYLRCVGEQKCSLLELTSEGAQYGSLLPFYFGILRELRDTVAVFR